MTIKRLLEVLIRVALSGIFAAIFYIAWLAITLSIDKSGFGGWPVKAVVWILAPIFTGLGFAVGPTIFELLPATDKTPFWETYKWCLAGCAIGAAVVCLFGPMLIVFGMFAAGTIAVVLHEVVKIRKKPANNRA